MKKRERTQNPVAVAMRKRFPRTQVQKDRGERRSKDARKSWRKEYQDV